MIASSMAISSFRRCSASTANYFRFCQASSTGINHFTYTNRGLASLKDISTSNASIDFKSIYALGRKDGMEEALKTGLTKAMRQIRVEHEEENKVILDEIEKLEKKSAYSKLAFACFDEYIRSGKLTLRVKKEENSKDFIYIQKYLDEGYENNSFDSELMGECLTKYGMGLRRVESNSYHRSNDNWEFHSVLLEDASNNEEDN